MWDAGFFDAPVWAALAAACAPLVALGIDKLWGEPPEPLHPVTWMGLALGWCGNGLAPFSPRARDLKGFWLGALAWCVLAALAVALAVGLQWLAWQLPAPLAALTLGALLKPLLAWRMLRREVRAVEQALAQSLRAGRKRAARLVSRDVAELDDVQVREAAIESLAENFCDSVVGPLLWFALLGLPGAALYRFANTADAMWGYPGMHEGRYWQWVGKWAARADDVLSWLPARLAALLLAWAARSRPSWRMVAHQARKTPSPNGGWPMAALALALGVRLTKPGAYALNRRGRLADPVDTHRAIMLTGHALTLLASLVALAAGLRCLLTGGLL
jgi:adenosylcobinamide-phosphate synthase